MAGISYCKKHKKIAEMITDKVNHNSNFLNEFIETIGVSSLLIRPVVLLHGYITQDSFFNTTHHNALTNLFPCSRSIDVIHIEGAEHSPTRGTSSVLLLQLLTKLLPIFKPISVEETINA